MQASKLPNAEPFKHLLAHELFHNWNGRKIGRQEPEQLAYWFSEGFTDYYAWKINLLAGIIGFPTYVKEVNSVLAQYHRSPLKNAPNKRILDEFWTNEGITRLPYVRGMLLAIRWNSMIRKFGVHSLDDFMRDLFQAAQQEGAVVSPETVDRLMRRFLPSGVAYDLEHLVENGETIELESGSLGMCVRSVAKMLPGYDLGFDEKKSSDLDVISDLRIDTNAYRAGLREGMKIIRTRTRGNDPDLEVTVTIMRDDGTKMDFRYLPAGPEISIPQFELGGNCL